LFVKAVNKDSSKAKVSPFLKTMSWRETPDISLLPHNEVMYSDHQNL